MLQPGRAVALCDPLRWQQLSGCDSLWMDRHKEGLLPASSRWRFLLKLCFFFLFQIITHRCREPLSVSVSWM